jgi:molybdenum cofactor cytidylyltransferase
MQRVKQVAAIILAAGESRRFGSSAQESKVLALLEGRPLVLHVARAALASHARPVIVVMGHARPKIEAALAGLDVHFVYNPAPAAGLSRSLKIGLDALGDEAEGALVLLADMPYVTAKLIDKLLDAFETAPAGTQAIVPVDGGRRGNPVLLGKDIFATVKEIEGDRGARALLDTLGQGVIELPIDDPAIGIDIDTPNMLPRAANDGQPSKS